MTQTVSTKGKRKITKADQQKMSHYQGLPGVYTLVREVVKRTREDQKVPWKQQKKI